jgi:hypothetical protein
MEQGKSTGEAKPEEVNVKVEDKPAAAPKAESPDANTAGNNKEQPEGENNDDNVDKMMQELNEIQKGGTQKEPEVKPEVLKLDELFNLGFKIFSVFFSVGYVRSHI